MKYLILMLLATPALAEIDAKVQLDGDRLLLITGATGQAESNLRNFSFNAPLVLDNTVIDGNLVERRRINENKIVSVEVKTVP